MTFHPGEFTSSGWFLQLQCLKEEVTTRYSSIEDCVVTPSWSIHVECQEGRSHRGVLLQRRTQLSQHFLFYVIWWSDGQKVQKQHDAVLCRLLLRQKIRRDAGNTAHTRLYCFFGHYDLAEDWKSKLCQSAASLSKPAVQHCWEYGPINLFES